MSNINEYATNKKLTEEEYIEFLKTLSEGSKKNVADILEQIVEIEEEIKF